MLARAGVQLGAGDEPPTLAESTGDPSCHPSRRSISAYRARVLLRQCAPEVKAPHAPG
jgi:hypothetical protein